MFTPRTGISTKSTAKPGLVQTTLPPETTSVVTSTSCSCYIHQPSLSALSATASYLTTALRNTTSSVSRLAVMYRCCLQLFFICLCSVSCLNKCVCTSTSHSSTCSSVNASYVCSNVLFAKCQDAGVWRNTISCGVCKRKYIQMWWLWQNGLAWLKWEATPSTRGFMSSAQRILSCVTILTQVFVRGHMIREMCTTMLAKPVQRKTVVIPKW